MAIAIDGSERWIGIVRLEVLNGLLRIEVVLRAIAPQEIKTCMVKSNV